MTGKTVHVNIVEVKRPEMTPSSWPSPSPSSWRTASASGGP